MVNIYFTKNRIKTSGTDAQQIMFREHKNNFWNTKQI